MNFKFITGGAGTGKSHTLQEMRSNDYDKHLTAAPTGIAALNCGGSTVHSLFRIDPTTGLVSPKIKYNQALKGAKRLYLDEISMVSADLLKSIYQACDLLGIEEIVAFGDLAQLKPVKGGWFFEHAVPDQTDKLTKNYRQGNDLQFALILNDIRRGIHTPQHLDYVNGHMAGDGGMVLAFTNESVNRINASHMQRIEAPLYGVVAEMTGNMKPDDVPAPALLEVKEGAEIVMLNNDLDKRWRNGSRGVITQIEADENDKVQEITVEIKGVTYEVTLHRYEKRTPEELTPERRAYWEDVAANGIEGRPFYLVDEDKAIAAHNLANGYEMKVTGTFTQFPMKLGYASTVHKSQGLTLDKVTVLPDGFNTSHGLGYVALSRLTSLAGLSSSRPFRMSDFYCNPKVIQYL